ncbi:MAG: phosphoglucosamine mutase [Luminiphilus sp.]|jgi:phosphoglucosamine mutase|nr:phosphoglucosamine mutase [Luminiphilus sp.]
MSKQFFGTDGIRGAVGEYPVTADFMLKLGWAAGMVFAETGRTTHVLIGKDTRVSGYMFESALEAGLVAAGAHVTLLGPMPTPAVAMLTRSQKASAGIVISASHNPYTDNGIKFFNAAGTKLSDDIELQIERTLGQPMETVPSARLGKANRMVDAAGRYIEFCKSTFPQPLSLHGLKVVLDCAHGATYHVAPQVLSELGASVIVMGAEPNGYNINQGVGSTSPAGLQARVLSEQAHVGVAFDGDGDRVQCVTADGTVADGDDLLFIIANDRIRQGMVPEGVVGTQMSNLGLEQALVERNVPLVRAKVGDRHVLEAMTERAWLLGGEASGHIICGDLTSTGDGIIAALQVMAAMVRSGEDLSSLKSGLRRYPQTLINIAVPSDFQLDECAEALQESERVESLLEGRGRLLLRASGTEPLIRIMIEGTDASENQQLAEGIAEAIRAAC